MKKAQTVRFRLRNPTRIAVVLWTGEVLAPQEISREIFRMPIERDLWDLIVEMGLHPVRVSPEATARITARAAPAGVPDSCSVVMDRILLLRAPESGIQRIDDGTFDVSLLVNFGAKIDVSDSQAPLFEWPTTEDVEEGVFTGVVRFCSAILQGSPKNLLLVGHSDTVEIFAACIVRERFGVDSMTALKIVRADRPAAVTKSELLETLYRYRPS